MFFKLLLLLSGFLSLFSEPLKFSEYNQKEPINLQFVEEFLRSDKIQNLNKNQIVQNGKINPEIQKVLEYLHPYASVVRKWKGSREFFRVLLENFESLPIDFSIKILEIIYSGFPNEFANSLDLIYTRTKDPKILSIAYLYLKKFRRNPSPVRLKVLPEPLPSLLTGEENKQRLPSLKELFQYGREERKVAFVIRLSEKHLSFLYLPNENSWTRFSFPVNTLSVTGLPFYITNGNTPQGLYKFKRILRSTNPRIGPTPAIQLLLPFEAEAPEFFGSMGISKFTKEEIANFLPETWRDYSPAYESFVAGSLGRSGIWIHGSTLNPHLFSEKKTGLTLTYGCISLPEIWENGRLQKSAQVKLLQFWNAHYVFLVEIGKEDLQQWEDLEEWLKSPEDRG